VPSSPVRVAICVSRFPMGEHASAGG